MSFLEIFLFALGLTACQTDVVHALEQRSLVALDAALDGEHDDCPGGGTALAFDGESTRLLVDLGGNLPTGNSARTVEMWAYVKPTSWAKDRHTLFEYGINTLNHAFAVDMEVYPVMQIYSWDDDLFFDAGIVEEGWFHVAASYDGKTLRAFINGSERGAKDMNNPLTTDQTTVKIGWSPYTNAHFDGILDEVRLWNIARSSEEIAATMSVRLRGDEAWLVGYWRFDDGEGTMARDASIWGHDAVLEYGPSWVVSGVPLRCP